VKSGRKQLGFLVAASLQDEKEAATTSSSSSTTKSFEESSSDTSVVSSSSATAAVSWVVPRRFVLGTSVALLVALGANFLGVTSALLSLNPALSRAARVDVLYPVQGYKRCLETSRGFGKRALLSILYLSSYFAFIFAIFFFSQLCSIQC
jgi:Na+/phosphate symporter